MITQQQFLNPPAQFRGKPFWSWNGKLEKDELIRQIHVMKEMGFGGFFMHSRTGLQTEYLGEEWFDLINACADEAEALGLEAWLYDEDRWPSGIAGGRVTENPEFRMKSLKLDIVENPATLVWEENVIAVFTCRLDDISVYEYKRVYMESDIEYREGIKLLVFRAIEMSEHSFYNGYTYVDTLNRKATDRFIELTHEIYKEKCGDRIGKSIKGIFTDEPHRGTLMDVFGAGNDEDIWRVPWTEQLPAVFSANFGYELLDRLPEIFLKPDGNTFSQVKWHYVEAVQQMFLDNFAKPIYQWCKENNLILTGHVLHEDSLTAQTAMNGSVMRYYEHMEYPGVDLLTEGNDVYWVAKQVSSVARQLGKKWILSELYGCTGWQMNFASHKTIGDWQALFGINIRCHHLSWYTMEGEAKRDYPASILHQSTWWKEYKYVEDYFSRLGMFLSQGDACCEVLVLNPVESVWSQIHLGWAHMLSAKAKEISSLEEQYQTLFHWLTGAHIDFNYGDEELINRLSTIEANGKNPTMLSVGEAKYKVVVVSGLTTIRSTTLQLLKQFSEMGGIVVFAGEVPDFIDAKEEKISEKIVDKCCMLPFDKVTLITEIKRNLTHKISIRTKEGQEISDILCQVREDKDHFYLVLMNTNKEQEYRDIIVETNFPGFIEEWNCRSGEKFLFKQQYQHKASWEISLGIYEEKAFVISMHHEEHLPILSTLTSMEESKIEGPYSYTLDENNVCVLDWASYRLDEGDWEAADEILKVDQAIRKTFDLPLRGGEMLQPWFANVSEFEVKADLELKFEFYIEEDPQGIIELVLEKPEKFQVWFNDTYLLDHKTTGWWIDTCFARIPVSSEYLKKGLNTITLKTAFREDLNLEAIYLIGSFGVRLEGTQKWLTTLPEKITIGNLTEQGMPFYSGKIRYQLPINRQAGKDERLFIQLDDFEGACVKVIGEDQEDIMLAWSPYEADITDYVSEKMEVTLEVVLTRRNTFGPLHQLPLKAPAYGPFSFVTEGDKFTNDYMLYPAGLLKEPKILIKREM